MSNVEKKPVEGGERTLNKRIVTVTVKDSEGLPVGPDSPFQSGEYEVEKKGERVVAEVGGIRIMSYDYTFTPIKKDSETSEPPASK